MLAAVRNGDKVDEPTTASVPSDSIQVWNRWSAEVAPKFYTLHASDKDWETTAIEGVAVRPLNVDEERDEVTMLVRMDAGTSYPRHRHARQRTVLRA